MDAVDNFTESAADAAAPAPGDGASAPTELPDSSEMRGPDLARAALQAAKEQSARRGKQRSGRASRGKPGVRRTRRGWSGARADDRDPQPFGRLASRLAADRGWRDQLAGGQVFARWSALVGADVSAHTTPVSLDDRVLTVRAESTAWATQLRLLQRQLLKGIADGVGDDVVRKIKVQGPAAPSWRHGPRHVPGRGPRDTYG